MRVIRAQEHRSMPWKNGGGETAEIAASPTSTALEAFDWRVSLARIETDGPFSIFSGVDRTFALLEGGPLRLRVGSGAPVEIPAGAAPLSFPGDLPSEVRLSIGPALALNMMTRRGRFRHVVERHALDRDAELADDGGPCLLFCLSGRVRVAATDGSAELGPLDTLQLAAPDGRWALRAAAPSVLLAIRLLPDDGLRGGNGTADRGPSAP